MSLTFHINSPFGAFDREVTLPAYPHDWEYSGATVTSRWSLAAIGVQSPSYSAPSEQRSLVVYDLHTDTVLASFALARNQLLLPSYNSEGHYHIANFGDASQITITTHSLVAGASSHDQPVAPTAVVDWPLLQLPEGSFTFLSYVPATETSLGAIVVHFDALNDNPDGVYAFTFDHTGASTLLELPPGNWIRGEVIAQADGQLMFFLGNLEQTSSDEGTAYLYNPDANQPYDWTELPSRFNYLDARHDLAGPDSVIRDGQHAFDLLSNWDGSATGDGVALPDGGLLIRASYWSDEDIYGFERWVVFRDGLVHADKRFDTPEGRLMRSVFTSNPDDPNVYVQQINAVFDNGELVQSGQPAFTIHRLTLSDAASLLGAHTNTAASSANQIATFSSDALIGRQLDMGDVLWVGQYQPSVGGALLHVINSSATNPDSVSSETHHVVFSSDPAHGVVSSTWQLPGAMSGGFTPLLDNQYIFTVGSIDTALGGTYLADAMAGVIRPLGAPEYQHLLRLHALDNPDLMVGSSASETLRGTSGDDHIAGLFGNDTIDGGAGHDTVYLAGSVDSTRVMRTAGGWSVSQGAGDTAISVLLKDVETLSLSDGDIQLPATTPITNDFNGDGRSDILWKNASTGSMWSWNGGSGQDKSWMGSMADQKWELIATGDFAGDGRTDMVWRHSDNGSLWVWNNGSSADKHRIGGMADKNWQLVGVGDFASDGKADMLWQNTVTGSLWRWNDGSGTDKVWVGSQSSDWQMAGVADFNGDGADDILWRNMANGSLWTWNSGDAQDKTRLGAFNDSKWQIVGVGDFAGDGKADIVWQSVDAGSVWIWNDGNGADKARVGGLSVAQWGVSAVGDYNGDGKADLLWHNSQTGEARIWLEGHSANSTSAGRLGDLNWQVVEQARAGGNLQGGTGNNVLYGTTQPDRLVGGAGDDVLTGGAGADQFVFNSLTGTDLIRDFSGGQDKLVFDSSVFTGLSTDNAAERISVNAQGHLLYDADGSAGPGAALHIATLQNNGNPVTALQANDIWVTLSMPLP